MPVTAFHDVEFPRGISYGVVGGPGFNTSILSLSSGAEQRNVNWSTSRNVYDAATGLKSREQFNELLHFFYARMGRAYGFRFFDWSDYRAPYWDLTPGDTYAIPTLFTTTGALATFQLTKAYGDAGNTYTRNIRKPISGSWVLLHGVDVLVETTDYTIDYTTGIVTLSAGVTANVGWAITGYGEFNIPVRFDIDDMKNSIDEYDANAWGQIPMVELKQV